MIRFLCNRKWYCVTLILAVAQTSCTSKIEAQVKELAAAKVCWGKTRTGDYAFDLKTSCFGACYGPVRVEVSGGDVVSVVPHEGVTSYRDSYFGDVPTIGDLFDTALHAIETSALEEFDTQLAFDRTYGHPTRIVIRHNISSSDLGREYVVSNLEMGQKSPAEFYDCGL